MTAVEVVLAGIVTAFELDAYAVGDVVLSVMTFRSGLVDHLTREVAAATAALAASGEAPLIQIRQVGGAINDLDPMATAYAHRTQNFCLGAVGFSLPGLNRRWDADVQPLMQRRYLSGDSDTRPGRLDDAFPGGRSNGYGS